MVFKSSCTIFTRMVLISLNLIAYFVLYLYFTKTTTTLTNSLAEIHEDQEGHLWLGNDIELIPDERYHTQLPRVKVHKSGLSTHEKQELLFVGRGFSQANGTLRQLDLKRRESLIRT